MPQELQKNIIIAGGGFGGIRAALELSRAFKSNSRLSREYDIILIEKSGYHLFTPALYETSSTMRQDARAWDLKKIVALPLETIFTKKPVKIVQDELTRINLEAKMVSLKDQGDLPFAYLILALGSVTNDFGIPGIKEHAISLKRFEDSVRIRNTIQAACLSRASSQKSVQVVIGGGGATGVELAGELIGYFRKLARSGIAAAKNPVITLIDAGERLLPGLPDAVAMHAKIRLEGLGVRVRLGALITEVRPGRVLFKDTASQKEENQEADIIVWSGGIKTNPLTEDTLMPKDKRGRCLIDAGMHVGGERPEAAVFAVGDIACFLNPKTGQAIPGTAYIAIEEAKVAAHNLVAHILSQKERRYAFPQQFSFVIPICGKYAIISLGWMHFSGFAGWIVRLLIDLRYFLSILPWFPAFRLWLKSVWIQIKND